jgi:hypothetical protein
VYVCVRVDVRVRVLVGVRVFVAVLVKLGVKVFVDVKVDVSVLEGVKVFVQVGVGVGGMQSPVAPSVTETNKDVAYWTFTVAFPTALKDIRSPLPRLIEVVLLPIPGWLRV